MGARGYLDGAPDWVQEAFDKAISIWAEQIIVACDHDFKTLNCVQSNTLDQCKKCGWTRWD